MKRKIAIITKHFHTTGITSVIVNYCLNLNLEKIDVTIFTSLPVNQDFIQQCRKKGIQVIELPAQNFYQDLRRYLTTETYDIAHIHGSSSLIYPETKIAKSCGINTIILHSHSTSSNHKIIHSLLRPLLNRIATKRISCSNDTGKWLFGKREFIIIPNGVLLNKYNFNKSSRNIIRRGLNIQKNDFVIGHIGRFNTNKNQKYLIDLLPLILKRHQNIHLILAGDGGEKQKLIQYAKQLSYKDHIHFLSETKNPTPYYSSFDLFAMPSFHEGMPVVAIEAQANGLQCVLSDTISKDINLNKTAKFLPLQKPESWADAIHKYIEQYSPNERAYQSQANINALRKLGYDAKQNARTLEKIYLNV